MQIINERSRLIGPTLFNLLTYKFTNLFNLLLLFSLIASVYNYDSLINITTNIDSLQQTVAIKWFHENKMIVNPEKFQAMYLINVYKITLMLNLLLVQRKLNFCLYIYKNCLKPQINSA